MSVAGTDPTYESFAPPRSAWREIELLLLVGLVLAVYFSRLCDLTIRGEEARWARVAQEMMDTGDWIVPRQQGEPFPDRPPLNSWSMIAAAQLTGGLTLASIRLPTALATLIVTLAIYVYGRNFLTRFGAFTAAAAYPTMAQVLQLGRVAESDGLLTLWLSLGLFCWHEAYACRHDARRAWLLGYALAALAALAKGPQGPAYFVAITSVFLVARRDWQFLLNRWHAAGLALFALMVALWQGPLLCELDLAAASAVWAEGGELGNRFDYMNASKVLAHWFSFPFELFACLMPWSFLLPAVATGWFRRQLGETQPLVAFALTAWAVALPTCWLPAESRTRYLMSLYPYAALLVGSVAQCSWAARQQGWWSRSWDRFLWIGSGAVAATGALVALAGALAVLDRVGIRDGLSTHVLALFLAACWLLATVMLWSRGSRVVARAQCGVLAMACFLGLLHTAVVMSGQMQGSNNPAAAVAAVRAMIPPGERLISIDKVHHLFAYYYDRPIELQHPIGAARRATEMPGQYFCFAVDPQAEPFEIPFAWERVTEISCERARSDHPRTTVVVGRRLNYEPRLGRVEVPLAPSFSAARGRQSTR